MSIYTIVFSPTGRTKKAADHLAQVFGPETKEIDLTSPATNFSSFSLGVEDICVVAVPSFGGRVPAPAISRLSSMSGNGAKAILVVAYGNRAYEDTLLELKDALIKAGFQCAAAVAAVAEHSIIHQFARGPAQSGGPGRAGAVRISNQRGTQSGNRPGQCACSWQYTLSRVQWCSSQAQGRESLYWLRPVRGEVPCGSDTVRSPIPDRRQDLHQLYALCQHLPRSGQDVEQTASGRGLPEAEKGMFSAKEKRAVPGLKLLR